MMNPAAEQNVHLQKFSYLSEERRYFNNRVIKMKYQNDDHYMFDLLGMQKNVKVSSIRS